MTAVTVLTCEHAGHHVPAAYAELFRGAGHVLQGHRGWDPGALWIGRVLQRQLAAPLFATKTTRLLVEPNRSLGHPQLFSEFTRPLDVDTKRAILARYYHPHRQRVAGWIQQQISTGHTVVHVGCHTFTPRLHSQIRRADVGLLYDPRRELERQFCQAWRLAMLKQRPDVHVRRNYPYRGAADGFTTALRRCHRPGEYLGLELEVNQRWLQHLPQLRRLATDLAATFAEIQAEGHATRDQREK